MDLDFVRIECKPVSAVSDRVGTQLHHALRGFEAYFKKSCCVNGQDSCAVCCRNADCPYIDVFARQLSSDPEVVRLHQKPSLPFSLYVDTADGDMSAVAIGIVIVGRAVNYVEIFHAALCALVKEYIASLHPEADCHLTSYILDHQAVRHEIVGTRPVSESVILLSGHHILCHSTHSDHVRVTFASPLRLMAGGSVARCFDFALFFRSQLRRCSSLCAYYGTGKLDLDFPRLSHAARNVSVLENSICYNQQKYLEQTGMAGLLGVAECTGLIEPMYALLLLGSYFNAGKGAAFGCGQYEIEVI
ncbi:MAG: CRISPR system precrRNA processing endoribonuclease RAMP protein Cas6 [Desulfuromonadaceae bacterium]|nr:CRISPR system precrRNA processing endoribonuclease RAMP protein Cas6 [Desulfuromonadaceae bacterium]MDD5106777.1 CRISPR system precrRNA processing endoribonuclease RAMP protein Cas6 [Desulfuromonadaceae bacterium]